MTSVSVSTPLRFPFIQQSAASTRLHNTLVGRAHTLEFGFQKAACKLMFLAKPPLGYDAQVYFKLRYNAHTFVLGLAPMLPSEWLDPSLKGVSLESLPPDVALLLFEALGAELFEAMESAFKAKLELQAVSFAPPQVAFEDTVYFQVQHAKTDFVCQLNLPFELLEVFANYVQKQPLQVLPAWQRIPMPGIVRLGYTQLQASDYSSLALSDIILLDNSDTARKQVYSLVLSPHIAFNFQYQKTQATFLNMSETPPPFAQSAPAMPKKTAQLATPVVAAPTTEQASMPEVIGAANDLSVHLTFDVGHKQLSVQSLQSLKPGFTFELENPLDKPVTITANGRVMGVGELLQIGEKMGVRILEIHG